MTSISDLIGNEDFTIIELHIQFYYENIIFKFFFKLKLFFFPSSTAPKFIVISNLFFLQWIYVFEYFDNKGYFISFHILLHLHSKQINILTHSEFPALHFLLLSEIKNLLQFDSNLKYY